MSILETVGFFWVVFAVGIFSAITLIAAGITFVQGVKIVWRRYERGEIEELKDLRDQAELNRAIRTGQ